VVFGDGEQTRDFIFVGDVVEANLIAATANVDPGSVYNVASGRPTSLNRVLRALELLLELIAAPDYQPERAGDIRHSVADVSKARLELGFSAQTTLEDGLAITVGASRVAGVA
jgi:nucleoside-diphosphate-sugar epimerase